MKPLDEPEIEDLLKKFYKRVRADEQLGPVFSVVQDWDEHLVRLGEFWSSIALPSRPPNPPTNGHSRLQ